MQFQRGQIVTVTTMAMVPGGAAMGKLADGRPVFVRGGAPNEEAEVRLTRIKKDFAEGLFVRAVRVSADRVEPPFPAAALAGADWSHLRYEVQLAAKQNIVAELLRKFAHLKINTSPRNTSQVIEGEVLGRMEPIVGAPVDNQWRYRNKVELTFGLDENENVILGFHAPGRFDAIIPTDDIALFPEFGRHIIQVVGQWANEHRLTVFDPRSKKGLLRNLVIRRAEHGSDVLMNIVTTPGQLPPIPDAIFDLPLSGLIWTENASAATIVRADTVHLLEGVDFINETFLGTKIRYHADAFFQTHTTMAEKLAQTLLHRLKLVPDQIVIDGYAGVGGFGLLAARAGAKVVSIESHEASIIDARANAERLGLAERMTFVHQPMEDYLRSQISDLRSPTLIVDPPRAGLHPKAVRAIAESNIARMFYVSCNPATLARDLAVLKDRYEAVLIQPFDLFPQTSHVETLVELQRKGW